jgi:GNAT superfamily N-acetyltransferase
MEPTAIRIASNADIPEMHRVRMSVRENHLADPALVQPQDYQSLLETNGRGWVAENDGCIVGFAVADLSRASIWALFLDPAFEGRGIGRRLHDAMLEWLFDAGAEQLTLTTEAGTRAERFYKAAQWQAAGRAPNGEVRYVMQREWWLNAQPQQPSTVPGAGIQGVA